MQPTSGKQSRTGHGAGPGLGPAPQIGAQFGSRAVPARARPATRAARSCAACRRGRARSARAGPSRAARRRTTDPIAHARTAASSSRATSGGDQRAPSCDREIRRVPGRDADADEIDRDRDLARHLVVEPPAPARSRRARAAHARACGRAGTPRPGADARPRAHRRGAATARAAAPARAAASAAESPARERDERQHDDHAPQPTARSAITTGSRCGRCCASTSAPSASRPSPSDQARCARTACP